MNTEAHSASSTLSSASGGAGSNNHVKFNILDEEFKNHHENLEITHIGHNKFNVNLGYLKMDHYYKVAIDLKLNKATRKFDYLDQVSSRYVSFKDVETRESTAQSSAHIYSIHIVFHVHREKLDKEIIFFEMDDHERLELHIEAKVLGVNQGTPLLRNGITLLHNHSNHHFKKNSNENLHFNIN